MRQSLLTIEENICELYGMDNVSLDVLKRPSVLYDENLSRSVYCFSQKGKNFFLCKIFSDNKDILFKKKLYKHISGNKHIPNVLLNSIGETITVYGEFHYVIFPYYKLKSINKELINSVIEDYLVFYKNLKKFEFNVPNDNYYRDILGTLLRLGSLPLEIKSIIESHININVIYKKLVKYMNEYKSSGKRTWIHGSLWRENVYEYDLSTLFIDFDNVMLGDKYYDLTALGLMFYDLGLTVDEIIFHFKKNIVDFSIHHFTQTTLFTVILGVRNLSPYDKEHTKTELSIGLEYYNCLIEYEKIYNTI